MGLPRVNAEVDVLFGAINGLCASVAGASPPAARPRSQRAAPDQLRLAAPCARRWVFARRRSEPSWTPRRVDGELVQDVVDCSAPKAQSPAKAVRLEIVLYA